ncbi:MAG TPA: hypothetical protein VEZ20_15465 [Allosphingosinicella sp.]|nr:hypothetical protein [Allosphingosinicella sp.]
MALDRNRVDEAIAAAATLAEAAAAVAALPGIAAVTPHPGLLKSNPPQRLLHVHFDSEHGAGSCLLRMFERAAGGYSVAGIDPA